MNTVPPAKRNFKKEIEAWKALSCQVPYIKETDAEPSDEQMMDIAARYTQFEMKEATKRSKEKQLHDGFLDFQRELNRSDLAEFTHLWNAVRADVEGAPTAIPAPSSIRGRLSGADTKALVQIADAVTDKAPSAAQSKRLSKFNDVIYEFITASTLADLELAKLAMSNKKRLIQFCPYIRKACIAAIERDDVNFFARVGDVLRKRQLTSEYFLESGKSKLQWFLIFHWVKEFDGVPPLYNLSILRLWRICQQRLADKNLTVDSVEKTRQRLGLLAFRRGSPNGI
jgi:hypothetical protein